MGDGAAPRPAKAKPETGGAAFFSERERYLIELERKRLRWSLLPFAIGFVLLVIAIGVGSAAEHERTCSTSHVTKKTETIAPPLKTSSEPVTSEPDSVESTLETKCNVEEWPKLPMALGGLGLLLIAPVMLRLLPPGAKFALGALQLDAGTGHPDLQNANEGVAQQEDQMSALARARIAGSPPVHDAPGADTGNQVEDARD